MARANLSGVMPIRRAAAGMLKNKDRDSAWSNVIWIFCARLGVPRFKQRHTGADI